MKDLFPKQLDLVALQLQLYYNYTSNIISKLFRPLCCLYGKPCSVLDWNTFVYWDSKGENAMISSSCRACVARLFA